MGQGVHAARRYHALSKLSLAQVEEPVIPALNSELRAFTVTQAVEAPRGWGVGV